MEREVGGGIGMGNTCKPMAVSIQCMTKSNTKKKKKKPLLKIKDSLEECKEIYFVNTELQFSPGQLFSVYLQIS